MTVEIKPAVAPVWAESGSTGTAPTNGEIQTGWALSAIPPARQRFNWILKRLNSIGNYFLQRGIPEWDTAETYPIGAYVRYAVDGLTYRSVIANNGVIPVGNPATWTRWGFSAAELAAAMTSAGCTVPCVVATTANISLSGTQTIDGVAVTAGQRVLVKNQSTTSQNGIYLCAAGSWTRATDFDADIELVLGTVVPVSGGTLGAGAWQLTAFTPPIGTGAVTFGRQIARTDSPVFTGAPLVPTAAHTTNDTTAASTAFVRTVGLSLAGIDALNSSTTITTAAYGRLQQQNINGINTTLFACDANNVGRCVTFVNNNVASTTITANAADKFFWGSRFNNVASITLAANESVVFMNAGVGFWIAIADSTAFKMWLPEVTVASASTTDLGAANSQNINISGTTTITSFGTVANGIRKSVRFAGALTLTHNGTSLILPGSANITTAANDTLEAMSLGGGNWIILDYRRASGLPLVTPPTPGQAYAVRNVVTSIGSSAANTPWDDTIPQTSEMSLVATNTIIPKNASSIIVNEAWMSGSIATSGNFATMGFFKDAGASAIAATSQIFYSNGHPWQMDLDHTEVAGSTVSRDYKLYMGSAGNTIYWNSISGTRFFGGIAPTTFTTTEYVP